MVRWLTIATIFIITVHFFGYQRTSSNIVTCPQIVLSQEDAPAEISKSVNERVIS